MSTRARITQVTALIDWNSQIYAAKLPRECEPAKLSLRTLEYVGKTIGKVLNRIDPNARYDVNLRLYHGWYKGFQETDRRKAITSIAAGADFITLSKWPNVIIRPELAFGDNLISAAALRLHKHLGCHLPNTLRNSLNVDDEEEKMVDTAIASDLVDLAHAERQRWLMLLGEDDDLVPPVFVAEGVRGGSGGRIILVRSRPETQFLKLTDLRFFP